MGRNSLVVATKRRLSATFRRATGGFIADCDARVVSEASDTPTHKESNTRRLALGRLSRFEASGHQAEQFSIGVSTGEQQFGCAWYCARHEPMRNSFRRSVPHCARASAVPCSATRRIVSNSV